VFPYLFDHVEATLAEGLVRKLETGRYLIIVDEANHLDIEAMELLRSKQQPDGTWLLENTHRGAVHFALEDGDGRPSRWNTLRALRVLRWYEQSAG